MSMGVGAQVVGVGTHYPPIPRPAECHGGIHEPGWFRAGTLAYTNPFPLLGVHSSESKVFE